MHSPKLIRNYSTALFDNASKENVAEEVLQQLNSINQAINADNNTQLFMNSPIVKNSEKIKVITTVAEKFNINKLILRFLLLITANSRMIALNEIIDYYKMLLDKSKNIKSVDIISSRILRSEERKWLIDYLEKDLAQKVDLRYAVDESLLGGIIIKYDSKLKDCSIAGMLERIEKVASNLKINFA